MYTPRAWTLTGTNRDRANTRFEQLPELGRSEITNAEFADMDSFALRNLHAYYDDRHERLDIEVTYNRGRNVHRFSLPCKNWVRTVEDGTRGTDEPYRFGSYYMYPQKFPEGTWYMYKSEISSNAYIGPQAIRTSAWRYLDYYVRDPDDNTLFILDHTAIGRGYLIHSGTGEHTVGCLKMSEADVETLATWVDATIANGGTARLTVMSTGVSANDHEPE